MVSHAYRTHRSLARITAFVTLLLLVVGSLSAGAADRPFYVYYNESDRLYRVRTDNGQIELVVKSAHAYLRGSRAGKYLVCWSDSHPGGGRETGTVHRFAMDGSLQATKGSISSVYEFSTKGDSIYFVAKPPKPSETLAIYRMPSGYTKPERDGNYQDSLPPIADGIDKRFTNFEFIDGKIFYTALRNGSEHWIACKSENGTGNVTWICKGAFSNSYKQWIVETSDFIYMLVNTDPTETQYSTSCMVLYKVPRKGGKAVALNAKKPLDVNAVYSGRWADDVYVYNNGIKDAISRQDGIRGWNFDNAVGYALDLAGRRIKISDDGVIEMARIGANQYVYCDGYGDVYTCTIKGGKVSEKKKRKGASEIFYVRNLKSGGKRKSTLMAGYKGTYLLNADMTIKKLIGVEWETVFLFDDMDGYLYTNAGDKNRLYYLSSNGKARALTQAKPKAVLYVEPVK